MNLSQCANTHLSGLQNAFITKLNSSGSTLEYSTFLGGDDYDFGFGIAVVPPNPSRGCRARSIPSSILGIWFQWQGAGVDEGVDQFAQSLHRAGGFAR
jgi:hypothetical protein